MSKFSFIGGHIFLYVLCTCILQKIEGPFQIWLNWRLTDTVETGVYVYSKEPHKRTRLFQFRLILFLYTGIFLQNQPEDVLKAFLKLFLEIIYRIVY